MVDTLTPPRQPAYNATQGQVTPRMIDNRYGDGYKQSIADGVNPIQRTWTLSWDYLSIAEADAIEAFLDSHVGAVFYYRLPREQAPRTWIWTSRQRTPVLPNEDSLTVSIEERFVNA